MNIGTGNGDNPSSSNAREYEASERREHNMNMGRDGRGESVPKRYSYPKRYPNRNRNFNPDPNSNRNPDWNSNPNTHQNSNRNQDWNSNPNPDPNSNRNPDSNSNHNPHPNSNRNPDWNSNPNPDPNSNRNPDWNSNPNPDPNRNRNPDWNFNANSNQGFRAERNIGRGHYRYGPAGSTSRNGMPSRNGENQQYVPIRGRGRGNFQRNNYNRSNYNGRNEISYPRQNYNAGIIGQGNVNEASSPGQSTKNEGISGQGSTNEEFIGPSNHGNHNPTETKNMKQMDFRNDRNKINSGDRSDAPQLVQEIEEKLSKGQVECMICYERVGPPAPVWSCGKCYAIFHLHCTRKWADSSAVEKSDGDSYWRCPGCQREQNFREEIRYYCFCGKVRDPEFEFYITPHSCGGPCGKPLDKGNKTPEAPCPHTCILRCHPGPCPTCTATTPPQPCPCGKTITTRRCNDQNSNESLCGKQCEKPLECGRHYCENTCHEGPCDPCRILINDTSCFCGKKQEKIICGDVEIQGELDWKNGVFQCENVCMKMLSCQNHKCSQRCHPGECGECEMLPEKIKSCPCGKTRLQNNQRKSCMDPVPTCSEICEKALPCGKHLCRNICHHGECAPCSVFVDQKCRCWSSSRTVPCWITSEENENAKFRCEKRCGRKKNCGKHRCDERCCPQINRGQGDNSHEGDWDPHLCVLNCGKKLLCGQHLCQELCHRGHCPHCLLAIFDDLSCACGRTSIPPPQPCGTPIPRCWHPCSVPQPCGHPVTHNCHPGDCPPCSMLVSKECVGNHVMKDSPCGSKDIFCNKPCGKTRQCGTHACARTCHLPPCDSKISSSSVRMSCGQVCGAPRRDCKHTCTAPCHPSTPCPDTRCKASVHITCSCGRLTAHVPCDAGGNNMQTDTVFEAFLHKLPAPLQPLQSHSSRVPIGQRQLVCNNDCAKLKEKYAFGLCTTKADLPAVNAQISDLTRREPEWVSDVEDRFRYLVLYRTKGIRLHVFCEMPKGKRDTLKVLAERYNFSVYSTGRDPRCVLIVQATQKSRAPPPRSINPKGSLPTTGQVRPLPFKSSVDMDPRLVIGLFDLACDANVSSLILRFGGECELVWLNDNNALVIFKDQTRAATALRVVNHASAYQGAIEAPANSVMPSRSVWNTTR